MKWLLLFFVTYPIVLGCKTYYGNVVGIYSENKGKITRKLELKEDSNFIFIKEMPMSNNLIIKGKWYLCGKDRIIFIANQNCDSTQYYVRKGKNIYRKIKIPEICNDTFYFRKDNLVDNYGIRQFRKN